MPETEIVNKEEGSSLNPILQQEHTEALQNKARTKGWRPLEEWHGPSEDWVDAKEFIGREKLFDRINDLKTTIHQNSQKFEKEYKAMADHFSGMREVEYKRALGELKTQLAYAKDEKDVESVEKLTQQVAAVEQERKIQTAVVTPTEPQADPEKFRQWRQKNEWFDKDPDLKEEAMSIGIGYSATHKEKTQEQVYEYVEQRIRKIYPEKFDMSEDENKIVEGTTKQVASVESSNGTKKTLGVKKVKLSVGDLDEREKEVMKTFIKRGVLTQDKYLEDLAKAKGLI